MYNIPSADAHDRFNKAFMIGLIYYQQHKQIVPRMAKTHRLYLVVTRHLGHNPNCHKPVTCDFFQQFNNSTNKPPNNPTTKQLNKYSTFQYNK